VKSPDITPAQVIAVITSLVGLFVSQGFIDNNLSQLIVGVASIIVPFGWLVADAMIRHGRSRALGVPPRPPLEDEPNV
jgi:uncharacterized membrane protein